MSKESYIGGDYIETTGGSTKIYAAEDIENSSAMYFAQTGDDDGVVYGVNEDPPIFGKKIVSVEWLDVDENKISRSTSGVNVSLKVKTANYEIGEQIKMTIKEIDSKEIQKGKTEIVLTGKVEKGGIAYLKEEIFLESIIFNEIQTD